MSAFRVGQRVRVVAIHVPVEVRVVSSLVGQQGTITSISNEREFCLGLHWAVTLDGDRYEYQFAESELAPLTDPRADEFIADMKRFASLSRPRVNA